MNEIIIFIKEAATVVTALGVIIGAITICTKRGRAWFIKPAMEAMKDCYKELTEKSDKNTLLIKRIEILFLISTQPENAEAIEKAFDEYVGMDGNSYIVHVVEEWRAIYETGVIKSRIKKK